MSIINKTVHNILAARGRETVNREARNGEMIPLLPLLIEHSVLTEGKGAILQIGANDGVTVDPVRESIISLGLPALLVEPLPNLFEQLKSNYAAQPDVRTDNVAVSSTPGEASIYRVMPSATQFPDHVHMLASFDKSVLLKHDLAGNSFEKFIETVPVSVVTFEQLLKRHPDLGPITALQIDTEGHDFIIVKSAVDAGCLPRIINYEHFNLSYEDQVACRDLLSKHGYSFVSTGWDTLAYKATKAPGFVK
jgi:FkbM family methyltransferase